MISPLLNFTGLVTSHIHIVNQCVFGVTITAYKDKVDGKVSYQAFSLICLFLDTPRWASFKLPYLNRYLSVRGTFIGLYPHEGVLCPCVSITDLFFIPASTMTTPTSSSSLLTPTTPGSSNSSSWKRLRQPGDPLLTPSKSARLDQSIERPSPSRELLTAMDRPSTPPSQMGHADDESEPTIDNAAIRVSNRARKPSQR